MVGLADHGFGSAPSPAAVGHAGLSGNFGLFDAEADLVVAAIINRMLLDPVAIEGWRVPLLEGIYGALASGS